jgi:hypothetical protein
MDDRVSRRPMGGSRRALTWGAGLALLALSIAIAMTG